jgi:MFS family permease
VCCFTPIYGRLCDIIGRQGSMLVALSFFSLGNIACAFAPDMKFLIAARAVAGIGGGGLTSVSSTIMSDLVPITHRGIFQGYGNIMFGLGSGYVKVEN